jgi:U3 small nucleolar RNA-associated protein MPP10
MPSNKWDDNEPDSELDQEYSEDGEGIYTDIDDEEFDSQAEWSDGDVGELAQEGDEDDDEEEEEEEDGNDEEEQEDDIEGSDNDDLSDHSSEDLLSSEPPMKKTKPLGMLARKLAKLEEEIADIESKQIDQKHWTLTGEVTSKNRPLNSLLEADVELPFGHMAEKRLDESIETMADANDFDPENPEKPNFFDIELIIRQRVADRTFDDVLRRKVETVIHDQKPEDAHEGLDFEKSQLGLAEVYAKQYEKDIFNQSAETEKTSYEKEQAKQVFAKLMHKLDSLTNYNFAPRPPMVKKPGTEGTKDLPAMKLEEPIPLILSSSLRANI